MLHACSIRDQSATTWDGLPGAARRVVINTFLRGSSDQRLGGQELQSFLRASCWYDKDQCTDCTGNY